MTERKYIETIVDADFEVNDCNGHSLWWKCPRCGHQHHEGDVFEWLSGGVTDSTCERCDTRYSIQVEGDYSFTTYSLGFSEGMTP